jgi:hypothetical protein
MSFTPKGQTLTGTGRLAAKTREFEKANKRLRVTGYGTTTGPLGSSVAYSPQVPRRASGGRDTWAR